MSEMRDNIIKNIDDRMKTEKDLKNRLDLLILKCKVASLPEDDNN